MRAVKLRGQERGRKRVKVEVAVQAKKQTEVVTDRYRRTKVDDRLRKTINLAVRSFRYELRVHNSS